MPYLSALNTCDTHRWWDQKFYVLRSGTSRLDSVYMGYTLMQKVADFVELWLMVMVELCHRLQEGC